MVKVLRENCQKLETATNKTKAEKSSLSPDIPNSINHEFHRHNYLLPYNVRYKAEPVEGF